MTFTVWGSTTYDGTDLTTNNFRSLSLYNLNRIDVSDDHVFFTSLYEVNRDMKTSNNSETMQWYAYSGVWDIKVFEITGKLNINVDVMV